MSDIFEETKYSGAQRRLALMEYTDFLSLEATKAPHLRMVSSALSIYGEAFEDFLESKIASIEEEREVIDLRDARMSGEYYPHQSPYAWAW